MHSQVRIIAGEWVEVETVRPRLLAVGDEIVVTGRRHRVTELWLRNSMWRIRLADREYPFFVGGTRHLERVIPPPSPSPSPPPSSSLAPSPST